MKPLRDLRYLRRALPAVIALRNVRPGSTETVADVIERMVDRHAAQPALIAERETLTYAQLDALANRVANHFRAEGVSPGDVVALGMENRPIYVAVWLGLAKIGATTALLNTNLRGRQLAHCLNVAAPSHIILGAELSDEFLRARQHLEVDCPVWVEGGTMTAAADLRAAIDAAPDRRPDRQVRAGLEIDSTDLFYIYTSGTTGLPKAAHFSHLRYLGTAIGTATGLQLGPGDRHYICLPLYHTAGGVMALGGALLSGAAAVIVPKFSASRFWSDAVTHDVTSFQYIGEMMRYLLNTAPVPDETRHRITKCTGNGLRPDIWEQVQERFGIERIIEFYGSTEGNVAFINLEGTPGSIGRSPGWLRRLSGIHLVRFDVEAEDVVRDAEGRCIPCRTGEVGEAIGRLPKNPKAAAGRFEGYSDRSDTEKKILRNVFEEGDAYFRTGDLLRFDENDCFYFVDRIGDTYRWKGENVATTEVAEVLASVPDVAEVNVYGVAVPGADGRAGMAAIVPGGDELDLCRLYEITERDLAPFARPLFIRVQPDMEVTGTFKHRKVELVGEGYDPSVVGDRLYFRDAAAGAFVPIDNELFERIQSGATRM